MTFAPPTLIELAAYWTAHKGINLGIVGDPSHTEKGVSYHLGEDDLLPTAYSIQLPRDKAGLSNAASAIDLGKLNGTLKGLQEFSRWLVAQSQAMVPGTSDIREIIYSPDGRKVQRYSGVDGQIYSGPGNGDSTHLTHTHISYYRDSEKRGKTALFARYFEEADMPGVRWQFDDTAVSGWATVEGTGHLYLNLSTGTTAGIPDKARKRALGPATLIDRGITGPTDTRRTGFVINKEAAFVIVDDVTWEPDDVQAELERAADRAHDAVLAR